MDEQSRKTLDEILAKEPAALTDSEIDFLRARRSYLHAGQIDRYAEVLEETQPAEEPTDIQAEEVKTEEEAPAPKRSRRTKTEEEA